MAKIDRFCVFCGSPPKSKNREHVIPRWLIERTGNPKRDGLFGFKWETPPRSHKFAFDSFAFPACEKCNAAHSLLETGASHVFDALLAKAALREHDLHILLDWLDKVRIGLWLGMYYLSKNVGGIKPRFFIGSRVRKKDRLAILYFLKTKRVGINLLGVTSPSFQYSPSCFSIVVNDVCIVLPSP